MLRFDRFKRKMWAWQNAAPETFAWSARVDPERVDNREGAPLLGGQALAALGTTAADDGATVGGAHAGAEAVGTLSADFAGLIRSFHDARSPY